MAALDTVTKMVAQVRVLLQDTIAPYRYPDADVVLALNVILLEAKRIRPDVFLGLSATPSYTAVNADEIDIDEQFLPAISYGICGQLQLRDEEDTQDQRAINFMGMFKSGFVAVIG